MTDVITLSDDEELIPLTPRAPSVLKTSSSANHVDSAQGVTAHISTVTKLNLEQIGIRKLTDVYNRNQGIIRPIDGLLGANPLTPRGIRTPYPAAAITPYQLQMLQLQRGIKRPSPGPHPSFSSSYHNPAPSTSTQRTRNNQSSASIPQIYHGHYMFEATETYEPSRRSTRFNTKKIDGKFVCSYNPTKCYKLCSSVAEMVNHTWAHVIYDSAPVPLSRRETGKDENILCTLSSAPLSSNSTLALKKLQTCEYCNAAFSTVYMKQQHVVKCHLEQDALDTTCNICELDFETAAGFEAHMRKHVAGDAPYNCQKCKYRTSVRLFFYQHFNDKHCNDFSALLCPICLYQEDLRPSTRRSKHIFVRSFVEHMRRHSTAPQFRCHVCALSFNDRPSLETHRTTDHTMLNTLWQVSERRQIHESEREMLSKRNKICILQRRFFETIEGHRINDEVSCKGNVERRGYDLTAAGHTLYECECGFKSWNGNRTASHYHRCRKVITDIEREREIGRYEKDPSEELEIFAVYPPPTRSELENKEATRRKLQAEKDCPLKLRIQDIVLDDLDDTLMLKMIAREDDGSDDIIDECIASILAIQE